MRIREIRWLMAKHVNFKNPVCLYMVLRPSLEFFTLMETLSLPVNVFIFWPILSPLSSQDSLECHTYCDTCYPFIIVISEDHWHCWVFSNEAVTTCFRNSLLSRLGFEHPLPKRNFRLRGKRSNGLHLRRDNINFTMLYHNDCFIFCVYLLSLNICSFLSFCLSYPPVVNQT